MGAKGWSNDAVRAEKNPDSNHKAGSGAKTLFLHISMNQSYNESKPKLSRGQLLLAANELASSGGVRLLERVVRLAELSEDEPSPPETDIWQELANNGFRVSRSLKKSLEGYSVGAIRRGMAVVKGKRGVRNPEGYLVEAVRKGW